MYFEKIISDLKELHCEDCILRKNGTLLLEPGQVPVCRHMFFRPLEEEIIQSYLVSECKLPFPEEYSKFLKYSNGANMFMVRLRTPKFTFAHSLFTIYGLPRTPPFERDSKMEEPFDIRIEDLARHQEIPKTWLKCGNYTKDFNFDESVDIFIDTSDYRVYSCVKNQKEIIDQWDTLDKCFCDIYYDLLDCKEEYPYTLKKK